MKFVRLSNLWISMLNNLLSYSHFRFVIFHAYILTINFRKDKITPYRRKINGWLIMTTPEQIWLRHFPKTKQMWLSMIIFAIISYTRRIIISSLCQEWSSGICCEVDMVEHFCLFRSTLMRISGKHIDHDDMIWSTFCIIYVWLKTSKSGDFRRRDVSFTSDRSKPWRSKIFKWFCQILS